MATTSTALIMIKRPKASFELSLQFKRSHVLAINNPRLTALRMTNVVGAGKDVPPANKVIARPTQTQTLQTTGLFINHSAPEPSALSHISIN
jgi:hypothetical protein